MKPTQTPAGRHYHYSLLGSLCSALIHRSEPADRFMCILNSSIHPSFILSFHLVCFMYFSFLFILHKWAFLFAFNFEYGTATVCVDCALQWAERLARFDWIVYSQWTLHTGLCSWCCCCEWINWKLATRSLLSSVPGRTLGWCRPARGFTACYCTFYYPLQL